MSDKNELFILPFDHRGSFMEEMFGIDDRPTKEEAEMIAYYKGIIYNGFKIAVEGGMVPKESGAILVDEQFGDAIIKDAKNNGYNFCICSEKSGQEEFDFEFGDNFRAHIEKYEPFCVKALIRYNPEGDRQLNERQAEKLKKLSYYCRKMKYKFMLEPLVPPTESQLESVDGDRESYDQQVRPRLMELMMEELQDGGVEPDIWKIEGLDSREDYRMLVEQAKAGGRDWSNIIILGRHASQDQVEKWLEAGRDLDGVVGFAIGRTIFWDPLIDYRDKKISVKEATQKIAESFAYYYRVFKGK